MARVDRLTALRVQREKRPGRHPDGRGLYLCISKSGARSWVLRFMLHGKSHDMGLGSALDVTLAEARHKAASPPPWAGLGMLAVKTHEASEFTAAEFNAALKEAGIGIQRARVGDVTGKCPGFMMRPPTWSPQRSRSMRAGRHSGPPTA